MLRKNACRPPPGRGGGLIANAMLDENEKHLGTNQSCWRDIQKVVGGRRPLRPVRQAFGMDQEELPNCSASGSQTLGHFYLISASNTSKCSSRFAAKGEASIDELEVKIHNILYVIICIMIIINISREIN